MIALKANGLKFQVPQSWEEVTFCQWQKLQMSKSVSESIAALTSLPLSDVQRMGESFINQVAPFLMFTTHLFDATKWEKPSELSIGEATYKVTDDLRSHTWGQKIWLQELMKRTQAKDGHLLNCMPEAIAIYAQPEVQKTKFNYNKAKGLADQVANEKLCKVYPVAGFFLNSWDRSQNRNRKPSDVSRSQNRSGQASTCSTSSGYLTPSTASQAATRLNGMR